MNARTRVTVIGGGRNCEHSVSLASTASGRATQDLAGDEDVRRRRLTYPELPGRLIRAILISQADHPRALTPEDPHKVVALCQSVSVEL